ncbi:MAG: hypothetical protein HY868_07020 [Chloroflexi bacterium]|nr:hypothetical protein [Chloroflexota bacterium]
MSKIREYVGNFTRLVEELNPDGYVVKAEHLKQLDVAIKTCEIFENKKIGEVAEPVTYHTFLSQGKLFQFHDLDQLLAYPNTPPDKIEGLKIARLSKDNRKVEIELDTSGNIIIDVCGPSNKVGGIVHAFSQHLRSLDQEYPWFAKSIILDRRPRGLITLITLLASFVLMWTIGYYLYASRVGVNINPDLLPGMTYAQRIEKAIQSQDLGEKMNALLLSTLRDFTNVSDILHTVQTIIIVCIVLILVMAIFDRLLKHLKQYFPLAFFAIGHQQEVIARLEKTREIWIVGILVAFVVNILAGIVVAVMIR